MICRPRTGRPAKLARTLFNWNVIAARFSATHQALLIEFPLLVAVGAIPVVSAIMILVGKAGCDTIPVKRPDFLDQPIVVLCRPFAFQKFDNR